MNKDLTILKAMLMLAKTLSYSQTWTSELIKRIEYMIRMEEQME